MITTIQPKKSVRYLIAESISPLGVGESVEFPRDQGMQVANFRTCASAQGKKYGRRYSVKLTEEAIIITRNA